MGFRSENPVSPESGRAPLSIVGSVDLAADAIVVPVETVDVGPDDGDRSSHVGRSVAAPAFAIDIGWVDGGAVDELFTAVVGAVVDSSARADVEVEVVVRPLELELAVATQRARRKGERDGEAETLRESRSRLANFHR